MKGLKKAGPALSLLFYLMLFPGIAVAFSGTFHGLLIPQTTADLAIPILMEVREHGSQYSGTVKTFSPMAGDGQISSGERIGPSCLLTVRLGLGSRIRLEGRCTEKVFEGKYSLYSSDGDRRQGTFRLGLVKVEEKKKGPTEAELSRQALSTTACVRSNSTCLAGCRLGDYSAELVCANGCKRRLNECKEKAKQSRELPIGRVE